jgi:hypothetical protein
LADDENIAGLPGVVRHFVAPPPADDFAVSLKEKTCRISIQ